MQFVFGRRMSAWVVSLTASCVLLAAFADSTWAKAPTSGGRAAAVTVTVPSPGDVSYAMARVHLAPGARLSVPSGLTRQTSVFSGRIGGLTIRARSASWRTLRATTHVYVVVAAVPGAAASERDVALFVLRRAGVRATGTPHVTFTIGNATAQVGSFWVHSVDRHGYANVFSARNILSTALGNWHRYTLALRAVDAVAAAVHPLVRSAGAVVHAAAAARPHTVPGPWTGGQHPDARLLGLYRLLVAALHNPTAYGALKGNPAVPDFITHELHNPALAARWRSIVNHVPAIVPDKYAALAGEEQHFTRVHAPRLSRRSVVIADAANSASQTETDAGSLALEYLTINNPDATSDYSGGVFIATYDESRLTLGPTSSQLCDLVVCTFSYPANTHQYLEITGDPSPADGAVLSYSGCSPYGKGDDFGMCRTDLNGNNATVTFRFAQRVSLTATLPPGGHSSDSYFGFNCRSSCTEPMALGSVTTLTGDNPQPPEIAFWTGCDEATANTCTVAMTGFRGVQEHFAFPLTVATQSSASGASGTVAGDAGAIDCGEAGGSCSAEVDAGQTVVLTAQPDATSAFSSWTGCPQASGASCTVPMNQAQKVTATFAPPPPVTQTLSVAVSTNNPAHTGYVTSSPSGIECGTVPSGDTSTCTAGFSPNADVTLTAVPNGGGFDMWTGCDSTAGYTCHVTMSQAKNVHATFG